MKAIYLLPLMSFLMISCRYCNYEYVEKASMISLRHGEHYKIGNNIYIYIENKGEEGTDLFCKYKDSDIKLLTTNRWIEFALSPEKHYLVVNDHFDPNGSNVIVFEMLNTPRMIYETDAVFPISWDLIGWGENSESILVIKTEGVDKYRVVLKQIKF